MPAGISSNTTLTGCLTCAELVSRPPICAPFAPFRNNFGRSVDDDETLSRFGVALGFSFRKALTAEPFGPAAASLWQHRRALTAVQRILLLSVVVTVPLHATACELLVRNLHPLHIHICVSTTTTKTATTSPSSLLVSRVVGLSLSLSSGSASTRKSWRSPSALYLLIATGVGAALKKILLRPKSVALPGKYTARGWA